MNNLSDQIKTTAGFNPFASKLPQHRAYPTSATHNFFIYGAVGDLPEYVDMITVLTTASESDIINIYLNTPGGCVETMISIIHGIIQCQGTVVAHAHGSVASAGTFLFLACPYRVVYPYAHFMFHDASGGAIGKMNENVKQIMATSELIQKLAYDIYVPTFTEEEVTRILEGHDYWCDAEEMHDRIVEANKIMEEKMLAELTGEGEEEDDGEPRPLEVGDLVVVSNEGLKSFEKTGVIESIEGSTAVLALEDSSSKIKIRLANLTRLED